jgi:hypothetical protein
MKEVSFGSDNLNKETPKFIKSLYRGLAASAALWMLAIEPRVIMPLAVAHNIDVWLSISSFAIYTFCQYFGYKCPDLPQGAKRYELPDEIKNIPPLEKNN